MTRAGTALRLLYDHAATGALHDSDERYPPPRCHPETRVTVTERIIGWYWDATPQKRPIMWVHAPAGYGKTAVAGTVADKLELEPPEGYQLDFNPVGGTFFFWRTSTERNSPTRFVITLVYQLALSIPELTSKIGEAVDQNPMILRKSLELQLTKLIVEPFKALGSIEEIPNRLVIVDGLDECINSDQESRVEKKYAEDQEKVQIRILDLIYTLQTHKLPLSFLVLSRPEPWIKRHFESRPLRDITEVLDLYEVGDHLNDVEKFLRAEFARIAKSLDPPIAEDTSGEEVDEEWPGETNLQKLISRTGGHILYAVTVMRHLDDPHEDPRQRLSDILHGTSPTEEPVIAHSTPFASLYELYRQILKTSPEAHKPVMVEVLQDILASKTYFDPKIDPLSVAMNVLDRLSGRSPGRGMKAIRGLHALLRLTPEQGKVEAGAGVKTLGDYLIHSSFVEFLQTPELSREFAIDGRKSFKRLLSGCLDSMSSVTLDANVDAHHLRFALTAWPTFWAHTLWASSEEEEGLTQVGRLMSIDLMACFVRFLSTEPDMSETRLTPVRMVYLPDNANVLAQARGIPTNSIQGLIAYARSSFEVAMIHMLSPEILSRTSWDATIFPAELGWVLWEVWWNRSSTQHYMSHNIVKALYALWSDPEHQELFGRVKETQDKIFSSRGGFAGLDFDILLSKPQQDLS